MSVIGKSQRYGFLPGNFQSACGIVESLESNLFRSVCANPQHVLFRLLPPEKATGYNLRQLSHHLPLPQIGNNFLRKFFVQHVVQGPLLGSFTLLSVCLFFCSYMYVLLYSLC